MSEKQMDTITIHKADQMTKNKPIGGAIISISKELQDCMGISLERAKSIYNGDAAVMFNVLKTNLPQGTRHELACLILRDSENLYRGV